MPNTDIEIQQQNKAREIIKANIASRIQIQWGPRVCVVKLPMNKLQQLLRYAEEGAARENMAADTPNEKMVSAIWHELCASLHSQLDDAWFEHEREKAERRS